MCWCVEVGAVMVVARFVFAAGGVPKIQEEGRGQEEGVLLLVWLGAPACLAVGKERRNNKKDG